MTIVTSSFTLSASKSQESRFETVAFKATEVMPPAVSFRRLVNLTKMLLFRSDQSLFLALFELAVVL